MRKRILFLCSGNYYRSRFAEHLFNWLAPQLEISWQAESRGLLVGKWGNIGPISRYALRALNELGVPMNGQHRDPQPVTDDDFSNSSLVVAVKEAEHRPVMTTDFPDWADRVEYWDVDDLDCAGPEEALPYLEQRVRALVHQLRAAGSRRDAVQSSE